MNQNIEFKDTSIIRQIEKSKNLFWLSLEYQSTSKLTTSINQIIETGMAVLDPFRQETLCKMFENIYKNNNYIIYDIIHNNKIHWSSFNDIIDVSNPFDKNSTPCVYYICLSKMLEVYSRYYFQLLSSYLNKDFEYKILNIENIMSILCKIYENYFICLASLDISCMNFHGSCNCFYTECKCEDRDSRIIYFVDSESDKSEYNEFEEILEILFNSCIFTNSQENIEIILDFSTVWRSFEDETIQKYINTMIKFKSKSNKLRIRNIPRYIIFNHETRAFIKSKGIKIS